MEVRSAIQQIAVEHRRLYGDRKDCGGTATVRDFASTEILQLCITSGD
jgi:hypothetical protein